MKLVKWEFKVGRKWYVAMAPVEMATCADIEGCYVVTYKVHCPEVRIKEAESGFHARGTQETRDRIYAEAKKALLAEGPEITSTVFEISLKEKWIYDRGPK